MAGRAIEGYEFPRGLWYDPREHLWLRLDQAAAPGDPEVTVGVDAIGVEALGEVVYVQLLEPNGPVDRGQPLGTLEAEKMVRPVLAPVSGRVTAVNNEVLAAPRLLNADPYGRGWLVRLAARAWEEESRGLLSAADAVEAWVRAEVEAHRDRS
jgi:glycine cleavage system H protein